MAPKVVPKTTFLEIGETLIFVDSIMIFMVFGGPEGSLEHPKTEKKTVRNHATKKRRPWKEKMQKKCIESDHQGAHRAERERPGDGHGDPETSPRIPASPRRRPGAIARYGF